MKREICLCPASINWIRKHLLKSARKTFARMITKGSIKKINGRVKKRKFSPKQLAAQRLFAKRAKAGTLRKRKRNKSWVERLSPAERRFLLASRSRKMAGAGIRGLDNV